jgi:hypothetical protein
MFSTTLHWWKQWDGILGLLHVAGISMATISLGVYQTCKWNFYNICKLLGIQTLWICYQNWNLGTCYDLLMSSKFHIYVWNNILIIWFLTTITQLGAFNWQSIYVVELQRFEWECIKWANNKHFQFNLWRTK